jgi:uncharacterized protein YgbK (DUF1537 family)
VNLAERLAALPPPRVVAGARRALRDGLLRSRTKLVVVDDDPTGTQTVHGVRVFMDWSGPTLAAALARPEPLFYVSTNSRSLSRKDAEGLAHELGRNLRAAALQAGVRVIVASRSDSTLRGHYPSEVEALAAELGGGEDGVNGADGVILVPAFFDAGRYTIDNVHWVDAGGELVPAHETEFARDPDFGFAHGDLREWVQEKTGGRIPADTVRCISIELLRREGPGAVTALLEQARDGIPIVANAACDEDLEVLALGVREAEESGKRFIYRTSASFVKVRGGVDDRSLLTRAEMGPGPGPGLVIVGSYVARTTAQVDVLAKSGRVTPIEMSVPLLVADDTHEAEVDRVSRAAAAAMAQNATVLVFTTRARRSADDFLAAGRRVMAGLCAMVAGIAERPGYLVAKGGITSIALARTALRCSEALVLGQVLKGVPVWRLGPGSKWRDVPYVVFPGNVGDESALLKVVERLSGRGDSV